jgi:hypothetical protein
MKAQLFEELVKSVKEGGAILRGEALPSRSFTFASTPRQEDPRENSAISVRLRRAVRGQR